MGISVEFTVPEAVLGFPEVRRALPKEVWMRVILWHSAVIYAISLRREMCLREQTHEDGTLFDFSGWEAVATKQIRAILIEIGRDYEGSGSVERRYNTEWVEGNEFIC